MLYSHLKGLRYNILLFQNLPAIFSLTQENGKSVLYGITSKGIGCGHAPNPGPIFADVFSVIDFVNDILVRNITSLTRTYQKLEI